MMYQCFVLLCFSVQMAGLRKAVVRLAFVIRERASENSREREREKERARERQNNKVSLIRVSTGLD